MECPALIEQSLGVNTKYEEYESLYGDDPTIIGRTAEQQVSEHKF